MYRAIQRAGFSKQYFPRLKDVMCITEGEAAAIYTVRHLKEEQGKDEFLLVRLQLQPSFKDLTIDDRLTNVSLYATPGVEQW
jgi:hypothetical protein